MKNTTVLRSVLRSTVVLLLGAVLGAGACQKARAPNTAQPEDKLLFDWAQLLVVGDKDGALGLTDLEARQKLEFWDKTLKPLNSPTKQAAELQANLPRLGDPAALKTVGQEAWQEVKDQPWIAELADGKCVSGAPSKEDIGRGVVPKERKEMSQELGMWVFELRTSLTWTPTFRVKCPKGDTFWIQLAQRKRTDPAKEPPLKVVRVAK